MKRTKIFREAAKSLLFFHPWLFVILCLSLLVFPVKSNLIPAEAMAALSINARISLEKARQGCAAKRWDEVISQALLVLREDQNHVDAHAYLALADLHQGRIQPAVQRLTWVNTVNPQHAGYRLALAQALLTSGNTYEATVQAGYAVQLAPQDKGCRTFFDSLHSASIASSFTITVNSVPSLPGKEGKPDANAPERLIPDKRWRALEEMCQKAPNRDLEILLKAILDEPDLLASQRWPFFQECTTAPRKVARMEIIRRFLRWKAGEIADGDLEAWLPTVVSRELWNQDLLLSSMIPSLRRGGLALSFLNPGRKQDECDTDWASALDESTALSLANADFQGAWSRHTQQLSSISADWHYQTARLALELWQVTSFDEEWLLVARDHLLACQSTGRWREEAQIILKEVEHRCAKGLTP